MGMAEMAEVVNEVPRRVEAAESRILTEENPRESVTDSMVNPDANSAKTTATTSIPAKVVERLDTESQHAPISSELVAFGMRPKYLQHNIWDPESELTPTTAEWSETVSALWLFSLGLPELSLVRDIPMCSRDLCFPRS